MSQCGITFRAYPNKEQKLTLSQWMGCSRFIYNAKCDELQYHTKFRNNSLQLTGELVPIDQTYAQFKTEDTIWLKQCPSQILRNSAYRWNESYWNYRKGVTKGLPKHKKKSGKQSIWLTNELFKLESFVNENNETAYKLFIGTKTKNISYLEFVPTREFKQPNSITISKKNYKYYVSFNYEDGNKHLSQEQLVEQYNQFSDDELDEMSEGLDRGVIIPLQSSSNQSFNFSSEQQKAFDKIDHQIKKLQKKLARQKVDSKRYFKTKLKIALLHERWANIRKDFSHKSSRTLVDSKKQVFVLEDLKIANMTKSVESKLADDGKSYLKNGKAAKSGLNRAILGSCWGMLTEFLGYKAIRVNKLVVRVDARNTSQECAKCSHTHKENRISQAKFVCTNCGNEENADLNAAKVIKKRGVGRIRELAKELELKKSQVAKFELSPAGTRGRARRGRVSQVQSMKSEFAALNPQLYEEETRSSKL